MGGGPKSSIKEIKTESAERVLVCRNLKRAIEDTRQRDAIAAIDAAGLELNAKGALHALESIQHVTIDLGSTRIDRTSTPDPEQAGILAALKADAIPNLRT